MQVNVALENVCLPKLLMPHTRSHSHSHILFQSSLLLLTSFNLFLHHFVLCTFSFNLLPLFLSSVIITLQNFIFILNPLSDFYSCICYNLLLLLNFLSIVVQNLFHKPISLLFVILNPLFALPLSNLLSLLSFCFFLSHSFFSLSFHTILQ